MAGVPTVWLGIYNHAKANGIDLPTVKKALVGGSALPESLLRAYEQDLGIPMQHFGIDMRIVDDEGRVSSGYFKGAGADSFTEDGWFATGDVSKLHPSGFMEITDRSKDVIKSGGEWVSSIDVENAASDHPDVAMAACIGIRHGQMRKMVDAR